MSSLLKWDGSYLGVISPENVHILDNLFIGGHLSFIILDHEQKLHHGYLVAVTNKYPVIFDEIKSVFGLKKIGSHLLKIKRQLYVFYQRLVDEEGNYFHDIPLSSLNRRMMQEVRFAVQEYFIFRDILGIGQTREEVLVLRDDNVIMSYGEKTCFINGHYPDKSTLTQKILKSWFRGDEIEATSKRLFPTSNPGRLIGKYRIEIEKIIRRLDKDYLPYLNYIIGRLEPYIN